MRTIIVALLYLLLAIPPVLLAQEEAAPAPEPRPGFQIRSLSGYAVYYSSTLPGGGGFHAVSAALPSDLGGGGSAQFGWLTAGERSTFSLLYTPSYTGRLRYSSWNALNHSLALNAMRRVTPQWSFNFSVSGDLSTAERFLFSPTTFGRVASVPATSDDLVSALFARNTANVELASALASSSSLQSPVTTLLYGDRLFSSFGRASVTYSQSPRLSFTFGGGAGRSQTLQDDSAIRRRAYLPNTTSGTGNAGLSYLLSPRTRLGADVVSTRLSSELHDGYTTTTTGSLGRTFSEHWFGEVHGGVGFTNPVRQIQTTTTKPRPVGGGSLGCRSVSHTLLGGFDRTVSDSYGLGARTTSSTTGTWRLQLPASTWWIENSASWERMEPEAGRLMTGWRATAVFGKALGLHLAWLTEYAYLDYSVRLASGVYAQSMSAVRVSFVWQAEPAYLR